MGDSETSETRKMTAMPMSFITKPALIRSPVFKVPLANIIALGGVAMHKRMRCDQRCEIRVALTDR